MPTVRRVGVRGAAPMEGLGAGRSARRAGLRLLPLHDQRGQPAPEPGVPPPASPDRCDAGRTLQAAASPSPVGGGAGGHWPRRSTSSPPRCLALTALMSIFGLMIAGAYWAQARPGELRAAIGPAIRGNRRRRRRFAVLLAYPIWFGFAGPQHYSGATWPQALQFSAHLSYFRGTHPPPTLPPGAGSNGRQCLPILVSPRRRVLGLGVLAVLAVLVWVCRRSPESAWRRPWE